MRGFLLALLFLLPDAQAQVSELPVLQGETSLEVEALPTVSGVMGSLELKGWYLRCPSRNGFSCVSDEKELPPSVYAEKELGRKVKKRALHLLPTHKQYVA